MRLNSTAPLQQIVNISDVATKKLQLGSALQSSTAADGNPDRALDGNYNGDWDQGWVLVTFEKFNFWAISLQRDVLYQMIIR